MRSMFRTCFPGVWRPRYGSDRKSDPFREVDCSGSAPAWMRGDAAKEVADENTTLTLHRCKATSLSGAESRENPSKNGQVSKSSKARGKYEGEDIKESTAHLDVRDDDSPVKKLACPPRPYDSEARPDIYFDISNVLDQCKKHQMRLTYTSISSNDGEHITQHHLDDSEAPLPKLFEDYINKESGPFTLILQFDQAKEGPLESTASMRQLQKLGQLPNVESCEGAAKGVTDETGASASYEYEGTSPSEDKSSKGSNKRADPSTAHFTAPRAKRKRIFINTAKSFWDSLGSQDWVRMMHDTT